MADDDAPAGAPEWVVTYGDMMSLLLTFFIMLVSLSELKDEHRYRAILNSIMQAFGYSHAPAAAPGDREDTNSMMEALASLGRSTDLDTRRSGNDADGSSGPHLRVRTIRDGVSLTLGGPVAFGEFEAELLPGARADLDRIAEVLAGKPNKVEIRGHTSMRPLPHDSPFADHYDLGYARARAAMAYLVERGIRPERIRLSTPGREEPLRRTRVPEVQAQNDRVDIFVLDTYVETFVGPRDEEAEPVLIVDPGETSD